VNEPAAIASPDAGLDRVMLAMDVVDTLRHQRELVERELDGERRQRELVLRVQRLYESQGIDVPADVVAEAVRALEQDRFVYRPPARTFVVRLAEIYVERGRWARGAAAALAIVVAAWAAFAIPRHLHRQSLVERFAKDSARVRVEVDQQIGEGRTIEAALARAAERQPTAAQSTLLDRAEEHLANAIGRAESARAALQQLPQGDAYLDAQARGDESLAACRWEAQVADGELDAARRELSAAERLGQIEVQFAAARERLATATLAEHERARLSTAENAVAAALQTIDVGAADAAVATFVRQVDAVFAARQRAAEAKSSLAALAERLAGVDVEPVARAELQELRAAVASAIAAGDTTRAGEMLGKLSALVEQLDRTYELRIVSRPGVQSGVWRYHGDDRSRRNYYIVVEAVGPDGHVLSLPIRNEEQQVTRTVKRFAVRVPVEVFERVKADKLDNNLIDDAVFGHKRRGAREPEFRFPVAGGYITDW
jgi:hypothetical protein